MTANDAADIIFNNMEVVSPDPNKSDEHRAQIAPIVLALLIQILASLAVKYGPGILDAIRRKFGICQKVAIRRAIWQHCESIEQYNQYCEPIVKAINKSRSQFSKDDVHDLLKSIKK